MLRDVLTRATEEESQRPLVNQTSSDRPKSKVIIWVTVITLLLLGGVATSVVISQSKVDVNTVLKQLKISAPSGDLNTDNIPLDGPLLLGSTLGIWTHLGALESGLPIGRRWLAPDPFTGALHWPNLTSILSSSSPKSPQGALHFILDADTTVADLEILYVSLSSAYQQQGRGVRVLPIGVLNKTTQQYHILSVLVSSPQGGDLSTRVTWRPKSLMITYYDQRDQFQSLPNIPKGLSEDQMNSRLRDAFQKIRSTSPNATLILKPTSNVTLGKLVNVALQSRRSTPQGAPIPSLQIQFSKRGRR